jgi:hypothetical protein
MLLGHFEAAVTLAALAVALAYRRVLQAPALIMTLAGAVVGALAGVLLQGKGFDYHYYPGLALGLLMLGLMASVNHAGAEFRRARLVTNGFLIAGSLAYVAADFRIAFGPIEPEMLAYQRLSTAVGPMEGRSLLVLAPRSGFAFGLVTYGHARWAGRFPCLWLQPVLYEGSGSAGRESRGDSEMGGTERWAREVVIEDALRARPAVILIGQPTPGQGPRDYWFDYLTYFTREPRFREFIADYVRVGTSVGYDIYRPKAEYAGVPQRVRRVSAESGEEPVGDPGDRKRTAVESQNQMPQSSRAS